MCFCKLSENKQVKIIKRLLNTSIGNKFWSVKTQPLKSVQKKDDPWGALEGSICPHSLASNVPKCSIVVLKSN